MRYCALFDKGQPGVYPAAYIAFDGSTPVAAVMDTRPPGTTVEIREIANIGIGVYTDNGRQLRVTLLQPAMAVDLHTWLAANVEFFDSKGNSIFAVQLPATPSGKTFVTPGEPIQRLELTSVSEFLLLEMCVEG